ncbi:RluA family pseudouridine synthase [Paenibacillus pini]|uniref:Pseudouridine synthase n=1 Tax=Paenibacillus pini JCM 16418 TaxID=1236976 RepID=W7Y5T4_9BACL|nr:RluA family pseudouridine synthase [Paenibacillus pini]GAF06135.1 ribosomal large subunit pseudouridine synthase D [Paenibacillus pini JCM 16418]
MTNKPRPKQGQASYSKRTSGNRSATPRSHSKGNPTAPHESKDKSKDYTVLEVGELLPFLIKHVSSEGRNALKSMLARGQISVNGSSVTAYNHPLQPGQIVKVSKEKIVEETPLLGLSILYEDDDVIVISKDAGLLSIATKDENEITAYRQLTAHVRQSNPKQRIFVVHRLDRDTSGVMMFAKREEVQQKLQSNWQDMVHERTYIALVEGKVKRPENTITSWLKETSTFKMYSSHHENDGQKAVTHYKTIQSNRNFSLLEVQLETGRKNQIRVHMQDMGHPIAGDKKYGAQTKMVNRLGLHAAVLAFEHPVTGQPMRFEIPAPKSFLKSSQPEESK